MSAKGVALLCAQAFLIQTISAFCNGLGAGLGYDAAPYGAAASWAGYGAGCGLAAVPSSSGGGFAVSSASPIPPVGVFVVSENEIGGILAVGGELPFLGTVGLDGALPTAGAGIISYGCGDGAVGIISEDIAGTAWGYPDAAGWGYGRGLEASIGYGPTIAGRTFGGYGCGL